MSQFDPHPQTEAPFGVAAQAAASERGEFIRKTYLHLALAVLAWLLIEVAIFQLVDVAALTQALANGMGWLLVLGAFLGVSWLAGYWARSTTSVALQYAGLGLYVAAEAVLFVPLLFVAQRFGGDNVIPTAALITIIMFGGLTGFVLLTAKDFSFLGGALFLAGLAAMGVIVCSILFGFELGVLFTVLMIALACGFILYETSNVLHHYRPGQHVAAALALFAALALLFWYALRLMMALNRD